MKCPVCQKPMSIKLCAEYEDAAKAVDKLADVLTPSWICGFCHKKFKGDLVDLKDTIANHMSTCKKHPMRQLEKENAELKKRLDHIAQTNPFYRLWSDPAENVWDKMEKPK